MEAEGIGPTEFSRRLGLSHPTVSNWITKKRGVSPHSVRQLSRVTNTPVEEIYRMLADSDSPPPADPEADRLLHIYRRLPAAFRAAIITSAEALLKSVEEEVDK